MKYTFAFITVLALGAMNALAHPGHGATDPQGIAHYLVEAAHVAPALLLGVVVFAIVRRRRSRAER